MRVLYNREQLRLLFIGARHSLAHLEADYLKLFEQELAQSADGYPNGNGGGRRNGHADPTLQVVLQIIDDRARGSDSARMFALLHQAAHLLEQADGLRAKSLPPPPRPVDPSEWCRSCLRLGKCEPLRDKNSGLCWWCWRYFDAEGAEPPVKLLKMHHDGKRIFQRDVDLAKEGKL